MSDITRTFTAINAVTVNPSGNTESAAQPIYNARSLILTMRKTGDSTIVTFSVYTSPDGTDFDTEPYQTFTISGAGTKQLSRPITVGSSSFIVKAVNGDAVVGHTAVVTVKYVPIYGR